jgi:RHS repeat-associated protein
MPIRATGTTPNPFLYTGERLDNGTGLYDLRARYYNQTTGRFWTRDAVEGTRCCGLSWNSYIYVKDNAVNAVDPTGRLAVETVKLDEFAVARGLAATAITIALICQYDTSGSGVNAVTRQAVLGGPQTVYRAGPCALGSTRLPHLPAIGPYPAPFDPDENWATEPGNTWKCEANTEGRITFCSRPCPGGGEESITWDPGIKYGEHPHWDYHRCDNTTCKIYTDGTSTCPPEGGGE